MNGRCVLCPDPILPTDNTCQRVRAWEEYVRVRASGKPGGSDLLYREHLDEWAHLRCVKLARAGHLNQPNLFDDET